MTIRNQIPPPPYTSLGRQKRFHGWRKMLQSEGKTCSIASTSHTPQKDQSSGANFLLIYPYITLIGGLISMQTRRRIRRMLSSCLRFWLASSSHRMRLNAQSPAMNMSEQTAQYSTSVPNHSTTGHRRRKGHVPNSTIWKAAEAGDVEEIERHIENGVDVNASSPSHGTPLSVAA